MEGSPFFLMWALSGGHLPILPCVVWPEKVSQRDCWWNHELLLQTDHFAFCEGTLFFMPILKPLNLARIWVKQKDLDKITRLRRVKCAVNFNRDRDWRVLICRSLFFLGFQLEKACRAVTVTLSKLLVVRGGSCPCHPALHQSWSGDHKLWESHHVPW